MLYTITIPSHLLFDSTNFFFFDLSPLVTYHICYRNELDVSITHGGRNAPSIHNRKDPLGQFLVGSCFSVNGIYLLESPKKLPKADPLLGDQISH